MPAHTAPPATPPTGLMGRQDLRTLIPELDQPEWLKTEYEGKGRRLQDIAVQLGCSRETVAKAVRDAGITIRTRQATPKTPPTPAEVEAAKTDAHRRRLVTRMTSPDAVELRETQVREARVILADPGLALTDRLREVLQARIDHPDASLSELAAVVGISKGAYSANLFKALKKVPADGESPRD